MMQDLQEEIQCLRQERLDKKKAKRKQSLTWKTCKAAPHQMSRGSATVCGNKAYIRLGGSRQVHSYNSDTEEWSALPECPNECSTLTVINGLVTAVGGWLIDKHTVLHQHTSQPCSQQRWKCKWVEHFPSMPTKHELTAVVCSRKTLVVAGGRDDRYITLDAVEVMDTDTLKWSTARRQPVPLSQASATVCGDKVYLVGGWINGSPRNYIFTCSLSALLQSQAIEVEMKTLSLARNHTVWEVIADLPVNTIHWRHTKWSAAIAVGGYDSRKKGTLQNEFTNNIYSYNTKTNSWEVISHMPTPRGDCLVTVLRNNKLMVVGGFYQVIAKSKEIRPSELTNKVEIATLQ